MSGVEQLDLTPGEWVEVRCEQEILDTLDDGGALDRVPFMPEMIAHCGRRYQVYKRADKTCDTVTWTGVRGMERTVHLKMLRCDGSAHGGCQAACLLFWKEAWLRRVADGNGTSEPSSATAGSARHGRDRAWLEATTRKHNPQGTETLYRCQATDLVQFSHPLPWWQPNQYVRDARMNDVSIVEIFRGIAYAAASKVLRKVTGKSFPSVIGSLKKTPTETLDLQPGEWVVTKSKEEILATLDTKGRNRGMTFDVEMLPFCGRTFRVLRRVERLIEESTGRLIEPPGVSIILENVFCMARYRRSCPRSIYPYWREIWLRRAREDEIPQGCEPATVGADAPCGG